MATYGLYTGINEGSLQSAASSLRGKIASNKSELDSFKGTLTDDIWKANAKQTLITGYDKLSGEVYAEIENKLGSIEAVCTAIKNYKTAEASAKVAKSNIESGALDPLGQNQKTLSECEKIMEDSEQTVASYCGG